MFLCFLRKNKITLLIRTFTRRISTVWPWLVHARLRSSCYNNSHIVVFFTDKESPTLREHTRFTWRTFDINLVYQVREYVENERITWDARGLLRLSCMVNCSKVLFFFHPKKRTIIG